MAKIHNLETKLRRFKDVISPPIGHDQRRFALKMSIKLIERWHAQLNGKWPPGNNTDNGNENDSSCGSGKGNIVTIIIILMTVTMTTTAAVAAAAAAATTTTTTTATTTMLMIKKL